jgi:hypothetical protein
MWIWHLDWGFRDGAKGKNWDPIGGEASRQGCADDLDSAARVTR